MGDFFKFSWLFQNIWTISKLLIIKRIDSSSFFINVRPLLKYYSPFVTQICTWIWMKICWWNASFRVANFYMILNLVLDRCSAVCSSHFLIDWIAKRQFLTFMGVNVVKLKSRSLNTVIWNLRFHSTIKGQIILKRLFGILEFSQKNELTNSS